MNANPNEFPQLFAALADAQGEKDWDKEHKLIRRIIKPKHSSHSTLPMCQRFFRKIAYGMSDCWYWTGHIDDIGYGRMGIYKNENKAHRISWLLFKGEIPNRMKVLHRCDIRCCVNPEHLFLGTQKDNVRDMFSKGRAHTNRAGYGEKNPMAILTNEKVIEMREIYAKGGISSKNLAKKFNVSQMTAYRAVSKQSWSHI